MAKVKVFYGIIYWGAYAEDGTYCRAPNGIIATTSQKKVAEAANVSLGEVRNYWSVTANERHIHLAMQYPGKLVIVESRFTDKPIVIYVVDNIMDNRRFSKD